MTKVNCVFSKCSNQLSTVHYHLLNATASFFRSVDAWQVSRIFRGVYKFLIATEERRSEELLSLPHEVGWDSWFCHEVLNFVLDFVSISSIRMLPCDNMLVLLYGRLTDWAHRFFFGGGESQGNLAERTCSWHQRWYALLRPSAAALLRLLCSARCRLNRNRNPEPQVRSIGASVSKSLLCVQGFSTRDNTRGVYATRP